MVDKFETVKASQVRFGDVVLVNVRGREVFRIVDRVWELGGGLVEWTLFASSGPRLKLVVRGDALARRRA